VSKQKDHAERPKRRGRSERSDKESRLSPSKLREAIIAALGEDRELMEDVSRSVRRRAGSKLAAYPSLLQAADALEPVLAEAVSRRPSFLSNLAYGTARLVSTLASEDSSSNRRLAELAESSHVGIVFVDLVGFTEYTAAHGDAAAVDLVSNLEKAVGRACRAEKGEVVKHLGDGFLVAFPSASQAMRGAMELRDEIDTLRQANEELPMVRIAVHAGRPSIERDDLIGHDVNLTSRLLEHCEPGEIIATKQAVAAAKDTEGLDFNEAGAVEVRGVPNPVEVFYVQAEVAN
jgi:class 3 adenylate cyclase